MKKFLHKLLGIHFWKYWNPYSRTCTVCERWEEEYFYITENGEERYGGMWGVNVWELQYEGNEC